MLVDLMRPRFGDAAIVLMGQDEDGTPHYLGDPDALSAPGRAGGTHALEGVLAALS